ncbi:MAG: heme exporter protein CcmB [Deltaproteobacteria bacterium]|nr:heme exporter protein CcmB [Deltaproteobacteria bacterium]
MPDRRAVGDALALDDAGAGPEHAAPHAGGRATNPVVVPRQAWLLAKNDLRQELLDLELVLTAGFFTVVVLVMFALAFAALPASAHVLAVPGMLWLAIAFVGALTLTRIFDREREADTLRAVLTWPVERVSIYFGKLLVSWLVVAGCGVLLMPALALLFPAAGVFLERPLESAALLALGVLAYCAVGTLFAAGLATASGKNVLLSVILYPLTSPALIFALVATRALLEGHAQFTTYLGQLAASDVVVMLIGSWLFEPVLVGSQRPLTDSNGARARARRERP